MTPEAYAGLRVAIDAGCTTMEQYARNKLAGCQTQCTPQTKPSIGELSDAVYRYIPAELIPMEPAAAFAEKFAMNYIPDPSDPGDRYGWPTFVDRAALLAALHKVTPPTTLAQIGPLNRPPDAAGQELALPSADTGGSEWWAVALSAAGVLAWLGRRTWLGMLLGRLAPLLLAALVGAKAIEIVTDLGKRALEGLKRGAEDTGRALAWVFGLGAAGVGGFLLYRLVTTQRKRRAELGAAHHEDPEEHTADSGD